MAHLILTVDYELFGNGTGCVDHCMLGPAERMMRIAERYSAPVTFFTEVLELMAMERGQDAQAEAVKIQLRDVLRRGHDAQLHLHPQWDGAKLGSDEDWALNMKLWRIGDLPYDDIYRILSEAKSWLLHVAQPIKSDYQCLAFRAGGWCIQPSKHVLKALRNLEFDIESTVAPGFRNANKGEWSDFRVVPDMPFWKVDQDVCRAVDDGLWELPIVTGNIGPVAHLNSLLQSRRSAESGLAPGCEGSYQGPEGRIQALRGKISKLLRLGHVMLDFSSMPAAVLIQLTQQWMKRFQSASCPVPLVAISHTKNFTPRSEAALDEYLDWVKGEGIDFSTFGQWIGAAGHE